ncbi:MAG: M48 family metallopeptidase [Cyanobacteria bacterium P01_E01_bin.42]
MLEKFSYFFWRKKQRWLYGLLSVVTALSLWLGTAQTSQGISLIELILRGAQIIQLSTISDKQEVSLGRQINEQITAQLARQGTPILKEPALTNYVEQIGKRLVPHGDRPDIPYTFQVVADPAVNAFATMGGFVYVNLGLMALASNEAELASVVSHEIGHITGRHAIKQMRERAIAQGLLSAAGLDTSQAVQIGVQLALSLPNSRADELDADETGLQTLREAGYAPQAMVSFMNKLAQRGGARVPTILSTHPATSDRVRILQTMLQEDPPQPNEVGGTDDRSYENFMRRYI